MQSNISEIAKQFVLSGNFINSKPFGSGHINDTFLTVFDEGGAEGCYIIQRINHEVFKKPQELMGNIVTVTEHIQKKLLEQNVTDVSRQTLTVVSTCDDNSFYKDGQGNYWRPAGHPSR